MKLIVATIIMQKLKLVVVFFILAELLDIITTLTGMYLFGAIEKNPFMVYMGIEMMILLKLFITCIATYIMQKFDLKKLAWAIPIAAILPVIWNIFKLLEIDGLLQFGL